MEMPQRLRHVLDAIDVIWEKPFLAGSYPAWPAWMGGVISAAWWGTPSAIRNFIILMGIDFVSGVIAALWVSRTFDTLEAKRGLARKSLIFLLVVACGRVAEPLHVDQHFATVVANAFSLTELASIVQNASRAGVWIPAPLLNLLSKAQKAMGKQDQGKRAKGAAAGS